MSKPEHEVAHVTRQDRLGRHLGVRSDDEVAGRRPDQQLDVSATFDQLPRYAGSLKRAGSSPYRAIRPSMTLLRQLVLLERLCLCASP